MIILSSLLTSTMHFFLPVLFTNFFHFHLLLLGECNLSSFMYILCLIPPNFFSSYFLFFSQSSNLPFLQHSFFIPSSCLMFTHLDTYTRADTDTHTYTQIHTQRCITQKHIQTHTHRYIHSDTYTDTYTQTRTFILSSAPPPSLFLARAHLFPLSLYLSLSHTHVLLCFICTVSMPISSPPQTYLLDPTGTSGLPVGPDICIGNYYFLLNIC